MKNLSELKFNGKIYGKSGSYSIYVNNEKIEVSNEEVEEYNSSLKESESNKALAKRIDRYVNSETAPIFGIKYKEMVAIPVNELLSIKDRIQFKIVKWEETEDTNGVVIETLLFDNKEVKSYVTHYFKGKNNGSWIPKEAIEKFKLEKTNFSESIENFN